jgi:hypothetical protein
VNPLLICTAQGYVHGVFVIVEDVVAAKGGGGREFWRELRERYDASSIFQSLLWQMNWFWGGDDIVHLFGA